MFRLRSLFGGPTQESGHYLADKETADLEDAIKATATVMDDDIDTAEKELSKYDSAFHTLGQATLAFMRAVLSAEPDEMRHAFQLLAAADTASVDAHQRVQDDDEAFRSQIYPPGAEFNLAQAETQLMFCLVAILSGSLTESIKGFYKIRRAYGTLSSIHKAEQASLKFKDAVAKSGSNAVIGMRSGSFSESAKPGSALKDETNASAHHGEESSLALKRGPDGQEAVVANGTEALNDSEHLSRTETRTSARSRNSFGPSTSSHPRLSRRDTNTSGGYDGHSITEYSEEFSKLTFSNPIDAFTHSGINLQYGILQVLLSLVPPTFRSLLSIVGFEGNRKRGLAMLWEATRFDNIHGAVAGLAVSAFYTTMVSFQDIYLFNDPEMFPMERCKAMLKEMRLRYPLSSLWKLEECRINAAQRQLEKAVELYDTITHTPLKQLDALCEFERGLSVLSLHRYAEAAKSFLKCIELNDWSHSLYYYIVGASHVELYRDYKYGVHPDATKAAHHAKEAEAMLQRVLSTVGKKRFMARQLPFDTLVARKINKWTAKAKLWDVSLIDAVGVSPVVEMIYFWGGHSRLQAPYLEKSLQRLAWSDGGFQSAGGQPAFKTSDPHWANESLDEKGVLALLRAHVYRRLGKINESKALIQDAIMAYKPADFKGGYKDAWVAPMARYELATHCWLQSGLATDRVSGLPVVHDSIHQSQANDQTAPGHIPSTIDKAKLRECDAYLEKVANWEKFDLDARFGTVVRTARETLNSLGY